MMSWMLMMGIDNDDDNNSNDVDDDEEENTDADNDVGNYDRDFIINTHNKIIIATKLILIE